MSALVELLAVLPPAVSRQYEAQRDWVSRLLGAPRPELRLQAAVLYAEIYARADEATALGVLRPLLDQLKHE